MRFFHWSFAFCLLSVFSSPVAAEEMWRYLNGSNVEIPGNEDVKALFVEYDAQPKYHRKVSIDGIEGIHIKTRSIVLLKSGKSYIAKGNNTSYVIPCKTAGEQVYYVQLKKWGKSPIRSGMLEYMCPLMR